MTASPKFVFVFIALLSCFVSTSSASWFWWGSDSASASSTSDGHVRNALQICKGDTRGTRTCNQDSTHRVCAVIGDGQTSFWKFTGQTSWCGTKGNYGGPHGHETRCPKSNPTWCICKWALAKWIQGEGCNNVDLDCAATDVCDLKKSYTDYSVDLKVAHDCVSKKCASQWNSC